MLFKMYTFWINSFDFEITSFKILAKDKKKEISRQNLNIKCYPLISSKLCFFDGAQHYKRGL